ncbi:hypothetical protein NA57DRAFT_75092 [Rhizodiscina lignyota]|uniref:Uncharacterized protein n=1 Tax=Rhizodiscina lignyota TaxID=1504668 RepID=A0A9P4IH79_9PEZI|nr:hypothetical protein NA57DRAFT_75092 [Rhizodiscina lignyota]
MIHFGSLFATLVLAHSAISVPVEVERRDVDAATKALLTAAPTSNTCSGATYPNECATAQQAAQPIIDGFAQYGITTVGEQAAALSIMIFESGSFKYNEKHFPAPVPGQGTRNMQNPEFNQKYVADLEKSGKLKSSDVQAAGTDPNKILALVQPDEFSFASAAWFISTQCDAATRAGLQAGTQAGYTAYLTNCVQTTVTDDRISGWKAALQAASG